MFANKANPLHISVALSHLLMQKHAPRIMSKTADFTRRASYHRCSLRIMGAMDVELSMSSNARSRVVNVEADEISGFVRNKRNCRH